MKTSDFDYTLPTGRIAQHPAAERDGSRLLSLDRKTGAIRHLRFTDLPGLLRPGDLLVVNDTRVLPARLFARLERGAEGRRGADVASGSEAATGREVEVLLLREEPAVAPERIWSCLARPARALKAGVALSFVVPGWRGVVRGAGERGVRHVAFAPASGAPASAGAPPSFDVWLSRVGHVPLPPYIERADEPDDRERYQTMFARSTGSVAAPTAGLHFTPEVVEALRARGVEIATVTLHVGPGTFRPVATEDPREHFLDPEPWRVPPETVAAIRARRGRVIAVGTTCVRALESWARDGEPDDGAWRETGLLILPGDPFRVVDGMVTNFHLPRSSLLMLVSALAGRERVLRAYQEAVREGYRFYSYGDAMLIT
jgi:S-adenosylmethionine:tRNA ribosyltransferase-isomerase